MALCNRFLSAKMKLRDAGELKERTFRDYHAMCAKLIGAFGKTRLVDDLRADDFEALRAKLSKALGPVALGTEIGRMRCVFKYAADNALINRPVAFGQAFRKPARRLLRKARAERGVKMFEAPELRSIIAAAGVPLRAMALLGINAALGQSDIANLPMSALDLENGWCTYPRPKTFIDRRAKLWPETVAALRDALADRPEPADKADADLVFLTREGNRWVRTRKSGDADDPRWANCDAISQEFAKITKSLDINGHRNFYCLRRGFETIGGDSLDQVAVDHVMGHVRNDMASLYRQRIADERLAKVANVVRAWLFPAKKRAK
jgi:integrase